MQDLPPLLFYKNDLKLQVQYQELLMMQIQQLLIYNMLEILVYFFIKPFIAIYRPTIPEYAPTIGTQLFYKISLKN